MLPGIKSNIIGRRYALHEALGQGGMGEVYRAVDRLTGETVALKRLVAARDSLDRSSRAATNDFRLALTQKLRRLASVRHPYVIEVNDFGFGSDHLPYFTMELLDNPTTILNAGDGLPESTKVGLVLQTLHALAFLHRRGIPHNNLKPSNILVVNGQVKLLDVALPLPMMPVQQADMVSNTTPARQYTAPEVLMGQPASEVSDLYAIGMLMYELMVGTLPFDGHNAGAFTNPFLHEMLDVTAMDIDTGIAHVIQRLLQKEPGARYRSADEVIDALCPITHHPAVIASLWNLPLVGRKAEIEQLSAAMDNAIQNQGSIWLIAGESGVGKSRLMDELRTRALAEGALVIRGQCIAEGRSPYQMWRPMLRWLGLLADLDDIDAGLIKLLVPDVVTLPHHNLSAAVELDLQAVQTRLLKSIRSMLDNLAQPAVFILEDLHWATSESLSLLAKLSPIVHELPLLIIASYQEDACPDLPTMQPDIPILKLNRLDDSSIVELSQMVLGEKGTQEDVISLLKRETAGNCFLLTEAMRELADAPRKLDGRGRWILPEHIFEGGVAGIIQHRLNHMRDARSAHLLHIAAVSGCQQDLTLLREVDPTADIVSWLVECADIAILDVTDGAWCFAHDRLRDGILAMVEPIQRQEIHRRVAEAIEHLYNARDRAAALAFHWGMAHHTPKESFYVILAGEKALHSGAYPEAVMFYDRAIKLLLSQTGDRALIQKQQVYLQHRKAEAYLGFGGYLQAERLYHSNLQLCEKMGDQIGVARSLCALGDVMYAAGDNEQARHYYQNSLSVYQQLDDKSGIARALNSLGHVAYKMGDDQRAKQLYQRSLDLSRESSDHLDMAGSLTTTEEEEEDSTQRFDAMFRATEALELFESENNRPGVAQALYELGVIASDLNDWNTASDHLLRALGIFTGLGDTGGVIRTLDRLGMVSQAAQNMPGAKKYLRRALETAVNANQSAMLRQVLLSYARLQTASGYAEDALEILSFMVNDSNTPEELLHDVERLIFEVEETLQPEIVDDLKEKSKNQALHSLIETILASTDS